MVDIITNNIKKMYSVTKEGMVYSHKSKKYLKQHTDKDGYKKVTLMRKNGTWSPFSVHRLVALHFIPNPENKKQVNHKDSNRQNNMVDNLEWCTYEENQKHGCEFGKKKTGWRKLSKEAVLFIRDSNFTNRKLALMFMVNAKTIYNVKKRKIYKHVI